MKHRGAQPRGSPSRSHLPLQLGTDHRTPGLSACSRQIEPLVCLDVVLRNAYFLTPSPRFFIHFAQSVLRGAVTLFGRAPKPFQSFRVISNKAGAVLITQGKHMLGGRDSLYSSALIPLNGLRFGLWNAPAFVFHVAEFI